jgi:outer membrane receptor protein involved in Fe transport
MTGIFARFGLAAALIGSLPAGTALAQTSADKSSAGLEEVVVTATRREERLQDVPISVSAFSQEKLDSQGLKNIDDLSRLSPGLTFMRNGMGSSANYNDENSDINIRGVDSSAGTSTTGIYIDDTPVQSRHIGFGAVTIFPQLFDLDRVEVLRGPQGTLFGAGAEGGAVRFITPTPNLTGETGYVRAETSFTDGGDPSYEAGAAFGVALIDGVLGLRVSASFRRDGGWVDRVNYTLTPNETNPALPTPVYDGTTEKAANWQQTSTFRIALRWKVNDDVTVTPSLYYQRLYVNDTAAYWEALSDPASNVYRNGNALTNPSTDPYWLAAIKLEWDLGFAQLSSNTSYLDRDQHSTSDYTQYLRATWSYFGQLPNTYPAPGDQGYALFQDTQRNFYQEFKLASKDPTARVNWTAGLYYSHLDENIPEDIIDPTINSEVIGYTGGAASICVPSVFALACPNGLIFHGPVDNVVDKQVAIFGEVSYKITDTLKATVGARYSKLDYTGTVYDYGPFLGAPTVSFGTGSASDKPFTPKASLAWQPDRDNMVYGSAAKGFRPGGINSTVGSLCAGSPSAPGGLYSVGLTQAPGQFNSDSLWSYELGAKNSFFDHRLQINASVFYIDWSNIQQNVYLPICGEQFTANLGQAESRGGDIEVMWKPIHELLLDVTAAYTDAKFTNSSCAGALTYTGQGLGCNGAGAPASVAPVSSQGDRLPGAPWSFTAAAEYQFAPLWGGKNPYLRLDYQYTTAQTALLPGQDSRNGLFDTTIPGLPVTNNLSLRAGMRFNGFDISVFGNNLGNAHPLLFSSRDIASNCVSGAPCGPIGQSSDDLYFGRGVRPRTIGITGTYRY